MSRNAALPAMCRAPGGQPHPLLVDRLVYVQAGSTVAETAQRIAQACAEADIDPERAVACVEPAPAPAQPTSKASTRAKPRKAASGPNFERHAPPVPIHPSSLTPLADHGKATPAPAV